MKCHIFPMNATLSSSMDRTWALSKNATIVLEDEPRLQPPPLRACVDSHCAIVKVRSAAPKAEQTRGSMNVRLSHKW